MITRERLLELFVYDPESGLLYNRISRMGARKGAVAGSRSHTGERDPYIRVLVDGERHYLHRLVWVYHYGHIAKDKIIDHINGNPLDNRIKNLRVVSYRENYTNSRRSKNNKSGYTGVCRGGNRWIAYITVCGTKIILGRFEELRYAIAARIDADITYGFHVNHGSEPVEHTIPRIGKTAKDVEPIPDERLVLLEA